MKIFHWICKPYCCAIKAADWLQPLGWLAVRVIVSYFFIKAGLAKIQSWETTLMLFTHEYHVPLLSAEIAAFSAAFVELVMPALLTLGLLGRIPALILFVFNILAVYSYQHFLFSDDGTAGLHAHFYWGVLLLLLLLNGNGKIAVDHLLCQYFCKNHC